MEKRKLNLAMLSVHSCPQGELGTADTGGMSVYIRETARELGRLGHLVDIYTRAHSPDHDGIVNLGPNTRLIHVPAGPLGPVPKDSIYPHLDEFVRGVESFRKRNGVEYDLVHSHYWLSGSAGLSLEKKWSTPHAITFHTLGAVKQALGRGRTEPGLRLDLERELVFDCQAVIVPTQREKTEVIERYEGDPHKIAVVPCGVDLELFRPRNKKAARQKLGIPENENLILYVGRLDPLKGLDRLLEAGARLNGRMDFRILVVGGGSSDPEQHRFQDLARQSGLENRIEFAGRRPHQELPYYYSAADVLVLPSYYESFGLVGLESLACGTPVVAADVGDYRGILDGGLVGSLAQGDVPAAIADQVAEILSRPRNGSDRALKIRAAVTRYSWGLAAQGLLREYRRLTGPDYRPYKTTLIKPPEVVRGDKCMEP